MLLLITPKKGDTHVKDCGEESILSDPTPAAGDPFRKKLAEGRGERPEVGRGELVVGEGVLVSKEGGLVAVGEGL